MAPCFIKYLIKNRTYILLGLTGSSLWFLIRMYKKQERENRKHTTEILRQLITRNHTESPKINVDLKFIRQLWQIIKIVIPGCTSIEARYILMIALALIGRTFCDLWTLEHIAATESFLVSLEKARFLSNLLRFLAIQPILSVLNGVLKYAIGELKIQIRKNLSMHLYKSYLIDTTFYRLSNVDNRLPNVDHLLTDDIDKFSDSLVECYWSIIKPILNIGIFGYKASKTISALPPVALITYLVLSGTVLGYLRKPVGHLTAVGQKIEGELRHVNARIATYSEEIAFYNGNARERHTLLATFDMLINHLKRFLHLRVIIDGIDKIITNYCATIIGWTSFAIPLMSSNTFSKYNVPERSKIYYTNGLMLFRLAQALGRFVLSGRELIRLAGFTLRVTELQDVLNDVSKGMYERKTSEKSTDLHRNTSKSITTDNTIKFDKVPIVTPNGDVLIKELTIEISSGMNVLVCGPNGSGKSSIFRILGELWPLFGGELTKPHSGKLFYIPQKPYMTLGSLGDQITYPQSLNEAKLDGCADEELKSYLALVELEYILEREGGFDVVADWHEILSEGEKQRIAMARLFYHAPQFAILDECTSSVAVDVENNMYNYCRRVGITLLTVSHRKSLWKHHEYVLRLDGRGSYTFNPISEVLEEFGP